MKRIQRRRTPGWHKPPGCIPISRGSPWGNKHPIDIDMGREQAIQLFKDDVTQMSEVEQRMWLEPLRGHDIMCWCGEDESCHGDYIIELCQKYGIA